MRLAKVARRLIIMGFQRVAGLPSLSNGHTRARAPRSNGNIIVFVERALFSIFFLLLKYEITRETGPIQPTAYIRKNRSPTRRSTLERTEVQIKMKINSIRN